MTETVNVSVELLKQLKPIFENSDQVLLAFVGVIGAVGGALATFFPSWWQEKLKRRHQEKSVAIQIYAEIKATLKVVQHRRYIESLRDIVTEFDQGRVQSYSYEVEFSDNLYPIYKANICNLGLLKPKLQGDIVLVYQLFEAAVQDMKPGGLLNASSVGREPFAELLQIVTEARDVAYIILSEIESSYLSGTV